MERFARAGRGIARAGRGTNLQAQPALKVVRSPRQQAADSWSLLQ